MNSVASDKTLKPILIFVALLVFIACGKPPGLIGPPYDLAITDLRNFQGNYKVIKRFPDGTVRRIVIKRTFKFRSLAFDERDEWLWTANGRPDYMLPSGITLVQGVPCKEHQYIHFHKNGNLKRCIIGWETWKHGPLVGEEKMPAEFHENGKLKRLGLRKPYRKEGKTYWIVEFDDKGEFLPKKSWHKELKRR